VQVNQNEVKHDSVFGNASHMRQVLGHKHDNIRKVQINGFCSAKSMVELTCHILENATSLQSLTVDTICDGFTVRDDVDVMSKTKANAGPSPGIRSWKHIKH